MKLKTVTLIALIFAAVGVIQSLDNLFGLYIIPFQSLIALLRNVSLLAFFVVLFLKQRQ